MWQGRHLSIEDIRKSYLFCLVCQMVSVWNSGQSLSNSKRRLRSCKRPCLFIEYYRSLRFRHQISRGTQNLGCFPRADKSIVCLSFLQTEMEKGRFVSIMSISSRNGHGWYKPFNCSKTRNRDAAGNSSVWSEQAWNSSTMQQNKKLSSDC